ncbi:MAG: exopolysaccharide biosynthesis protein [Chthoniobacteraceae bacterium]
MTSHLLEPAIGSDPLPARRLSDDLRELLIQADGRSLTLGQLEQILQGRGFALFILLLSLPFCAPITIPGLSVPFGIVITFLGLRIVFGRKPELPGFILHKELKYATLERIVSLGLKLCTRMEKIARPRMQFLRTWPGMMNLIGLGLASGGIQLLLPLPPLIPLSNTIPAISVVLLTAGMVERDGVFVLAGYATNLAAWIYFAFMFGAVGEGIRHLLHR